MIYFVKCGRAVKIGYTNDIKKRLSELQSANPVKLKLMAVTPGTQGLEKIFHEVLAPWKIHGEWFHTSNKLKSPLRKLIVLIDSGARPQTLADIELLRDFGPGVRHGRGADKLSMGLKRRSVDLTSAKVRS